jgi:hypothetical protein
MAARRPDFWAEGNNTAIDGHGNSENWDIAETPQHDQRLQRVETPGFSPGSNFITLDDDVCVPDDFERPHVEDGEKSADFSQN